MARPALTVLGPAHRYGRTKNNRRGLAVDFEVDEGLVFRQVPNDRMPFRQGQGRLEVGVLQQAPQVLQAIIPLAQGQLGHRFQFVR